MLEINGAMVAAWSVKMVLPIASSATTQSLGVSDATSTSHWTLRQEHVQAARQGRGAMGRKDVR